MFSGEVGAHSAEYLKWFESYSSEVEEKKLDSELDYDSKHYHHDSQIWPDYLDFIDEWKFRKSELLAHSKRDFMRRFFVIPNRTLLCGDHHHTFTNDANLAKDGVILLEDTGSYDNDACWAKTIAESTSRIAIRGDDSNIINLANSIEAYLTVITRTRLALEGLPPKMLSFDSYREVWWGQETVEHARELLTRSDDLPQLTSNIKREITRGRDELEVGAKPHVLENDPERVERDHGFHRCLLTYHSPRQLIYKMNQLRREHNALAISAHRASQYMRDCEYCSSHQGREARHPQMLIYAHSGSGKTYSLIHEHLTAIDTDWIVSGTNFKKTLSWFWNNGFSIVTNNHKLLYSANTKVYAYVNASRLRQQHPKRAELWLKDIYKTIGYLHTDCVVWEDLSKDSYLSQKLLEMSIAANFYHYVLDRVWCGEKGRTRFRLPPGHSYSEVLIELSTGSDTIQTAVHRKRSKWRATRRSKNKGKTNQRLEDFIPRP